MSVVQCTKLLAKHFTTVLGFDTSANQIKHANESNAFDNVSYDIADGHTIPVSDGSVDLVTCSQSFHWLDTSKFYPELNRILRRNGVIALISYEMPYVILSGEAQKSNESDVARQLIRTFYAHPKIKPYWSAKERHLVDTGLKTVTLEIPNQIRISDNLLNDGVSATSIVGYIHSWSAYQLLREQNPNEADAFIDEFNKTAEQICGDLDANCFSVEFPFHLLMARKS